MIIYKITNQINSKIYIGLTTCSLKERWQNHKHCVKSDPRHLYYAMRKYGIENFTIEQIDEADNLEELGKLEYKYIQNNIILETLILGIIYQLEEKPINQTVMVGPSSL